jgi:hypothetical protein
MLTPMAASPLRERAPTAPREVDGPDDREDVPAAVVCAACGLADCAGCDVDTTHSGVVALVPWERPHAAWPQRLWQTAQLATREADLFFEALPDGPLVPALTFAVACEVFAGVAMIVTALPIVALLAPRWVFHVAQDPDALALVERIGFASVPALAVLMVLAHVAHGLALEAGARRVGGRPALRRALRFGFYSAGWDVVLGPVGMAVTALVDGPRAALSVVGLGVGLPSRAARAFLRGISRLDDPRIKKAMFVGNAAALVVTVVGALLVLALLTFLAFV